LHGSKTCSIDFLANSSVCSSGVISFLARVVFSAYVCPLIVFPYSAPFKEPTEGVASTQESCLKELSDLAENLQHHRKDRGDRVHEVATMTAQRSIDLLHEQRRLAEKKTPSDRPLLNDEALPTAIEAMKLWFGRLIKAAALAFEFEYFDRNPN
jgi:hypothetical protein